MNAPNPRLETEIPDKLFFKIGEVCDLVGVQAHVLRYWESEFPSFAPQKNPAGQRTYRRKDVEIALRIKELLYGEGFTIAGAKRKLQNERPGTPRLKIVPPNATYSSENEEDPQPATLANEPATTDYQSSPSPASPGIPRGAPRDGLLRLKIMLEDILTTLDRNVLD